MYFNIIRELNKNEIEVIPPYISDLKNLSQL